MALLYRGLICWEACHFLHVVGDFEWVQAPLVIHNPHALPLFREPRGSKRHLDGKPKDAALRFKPDTGSATLQGTGTGGRIGATGGTLLTQYVLKNHVSHPIDPPLQSVQVCALLRSGGDESRTGSGSTHQSGSGLTAWPEFSGKQYLPFCRVSCKILRRKMSGPKSCATQLREIKGPSCSLEPTRTHSQTGFLPSQMRKRRRRNDCEQIPAVDTAFCIISAGPLGLCSLRLLFLLDLLELLAVYYAPPACNPTVCFEKLQNACLPNEDRSGS